MGKKDVEVPIGKELKKNEEVRGGAEVWRGGRWRERNGGGRDGENNGEVRGTREGGKG